MPTEYIVASAIIEIRMCQREYCVPQNGIQMMLAYQTMVILVGRDYHLQLISAY